jgi:hypothetical protein
MSANDEFQITDDGLLDLLGHALRVTDPVPDHVLAAAKGAVAWRTIDQDLAELVFDSALEATGVRDRDIARQLTFRADDLEVEVMLVDTEPRRLVGQVVPATATTVRLESTAEVAEQESDKYGRFTFDQVATGPVRISIGGGDGRPGVLTDWVLL